tara:strand:+ start:8896 stop:10689 length:1794 start_codon:yes stop_codon:yes gene_type:complete
MNVTSPISEPFLAAQILEAQNLMRAEQFSAAVEFLTPVVKAIRFDPAKPAELFALLLMADAQRFKGLPGDAYQNYVIASELDPKQLSRLQKHILRCVSEMQEPIVSPTFEKHLIEYFNNPALDNTSVDRISIKLLKQKFQLEKDDAQLEFSEIIADPFLPHAISHLILADPHVEIFLNQLRNQVFTLALESDLIEELQGIVIALAEHAERVEYAFSVTDSERVVLLGIKTLLETEVHNESQLQQHLGPLMLYAMFESIGNLSFCRELKISNIQEWPTAIQPLLKKTLIDRTTEQELGGSITQLGAIIRDVSKAVMNQYEQNPYPRWEHIFITDKKVRYLEMFPTIKPATRKAKKFSKSIDCLIAGAGTGKQPLWLAANCQDIKILALDLSLPSLSYAKRQAIELKLDQHVEFCQGDILDLEAVDRKFDVIECSGVLHHMEDPEAGLKILLKRLRSDGLLRIGLYSRIARDKIGVNSARVDNPAATLEDIRTTRADHIDTEANLAKTSRDFYTASECRDLLFHVQEHQFDIPQIKSLLDRNDLDFLGFSPLSPGVDEVFRNRFGPKADFLDLDNWHIFEQENPYVFKGMYQFHCQKCG